jgi:DNA-binding NtrC family response regulator
VDDLSPYVQIKLLRFLERKEFERLGGTQSLQADVRVIAVSKVDLKEKIKKNTFREDLFYRLNVISIKIPSLRERKEDIPYLWSILFKSMQQDMEKTLRMYLLSI